MSLIEQRCVQTHHAHKCVDTTCLASQRVQRIFPHDTARQDEYQRLRATVFVHRLKWKIFVDEEGRERDHYDQQETPSTSIYGVYGVHNENESLLGGVRIFELHHWQDSMVANEFYAAGMIPDTALAALASQHDCRDFLELTRFCVRRGRWYTPPSLSTRFNCEIARDLTYAAAYHVAEKTGRWHALALVHTSYLQVMKRSHFVFQEIYMHNTHEKSGYSLTDIDLLATIRALSAAGEFARAERMTAFCTETTR
ncbi:MAG: acyl-homoserine-lactone synthase [Ktedonobacteraceae bacterium]